MSILSVTLQGRFGNQTLQWLFGYAFALKHGLEFQCPEWVGERIFALPEYRRPSLREYEMLRVNEDELGRLALNGINLEFRGYAQTQFCASHYTKRQAQSWLKLRPEIVEACVKNTADHGGTIACHRRVGDYFGYSYPVISLVSYQMACRGFGLDWSRARLITEEDPTAHIGLPDDLCFMPDFFRLMTASTLLRGNSSFSWIAGLLGHGLVLAPVIDGLEGGKEHHCQFVAGNHPKFANLSFVEDLYVSP